MEKKTLSIAAGPYIAVFDSGVGGLTVLAELRKTFPKHSFLYLGDTARVPYGTKSPTMVIRYALEAAWFLSRYPLDCLVIGCNTVSAVAIPALRAAHPNLPILEVITPGAEAAVAATRNKRILILGTEGTIQSRAYQKAIHSMDPEMEVFGVACTLFVPLAEEGVIQGAIPKLVAEQYLQKALSQDIDTIVLGCTHFPLLRPIIQEIAGDKVQIVDSNATLAQKLKTYLPLIPQEKPRLRMFTTDIPNRFMRIESLFLEGPIEEPTHIDLESMFYAAERKDNPI